MQEIGKKYTRALFALSNDRFKTYKEYTLERVICGTSHIYTPQIRIEKNRGFNKSTNINCWLVIQDADNWNRCTRLTGLRPVKKMRAHFGDQKEAAKGKPKSLLILQFSDDYKNLVVDYFPNFYPYTPQIRATIFDAHDYYFQ